MEQRLEFFVSQDILEKLLHFISLTEEEQTKILEELERGEDN